MFWILWSAEVVCPAQAAEEAMSKVSSQRGLHRGGVVGAEASSTSPQEMRDIFVRINIMGNV